MKRIIATLFAIAFFAGLDQFCAASSIIYAPGGTTLSLPVPEGVLNLRAVSPEVIEVKVVAKGATPKYESVTVVNALPVKTKLSEKNGELLFSTGNVTAAVEKETGRVRFLDNSGREILAESKAGRRFTKTTVTGEDSWTPEQSFESPADESLYGLGEHQDGRLDWRGETICLRQANTEASVPFLWSTRSYGILWDNPSETWLNPGEPVALSNNSGTIKTAKTGRYSLWLDYGVSGSQRGESAILVDGQPVVSLLNFWITPGVGGSLQLEAGREYAVQLHAAAPATLSLHDADSATTTWRSKVGEAIDYYYVGGRTPLEVMANYRAVSGQVPMLPKYALGFWQCRERYGSSQELTDTITQFRLRQIPVDIIVQDWKYWGKYGWNAMKWDEQFYPDVPALTRCLHALHARLLVSVWPRFDKQTEPWKALKAIGGIVDDTCWFDPTSTETRSLYWQFSKKAFFDLGIDGYWQDAAEPEEAVLQGKQLKLGTGDRYLNAYPLFVNQGVYEGQRKATDQQRVCILTRCAYAGQQRYGTVIWSGDINSSWNSLQRQITAGLGLVSAGLPYWTYDAGGFFRNDANPSGIGNPGQQYDSPDYREKLVRWLQCATFFPVQRLHGYQSQTEPWRYGTETENLLVDSIKLRYRLLPYTYSEAWRIHDGGTMMRPLAMDFPEEPALRKVKDEFLCGDALLVAPILEGKGKLNDQAVIPAANAPTTGGVVQLMKASNSGNPAMVASEPSYRRVILPTGAKWYDFWSGKPVGNGAITVSAPINLIPLFVRAGSILPFGPALQYVTEKPADPLEIRIYDGANGSFTLYEDENDNYNYEQGKYATISFVWNDAKQRLTIGERKGGFPGMLGARTFRLVRVAPGRGVGDQETADAKVVKYTGKAIRVDCR